jgi:hypothetical protein
MEELVKKIDLKKVGNVSMIVAGAVLTFYIMSIYKTNLEIKFLKKQLNE